MSILVAELMALRGVNDHEFGVAPTLKLRLVIPGRRRIGELEHVAGETLAIWPPVAMVPVEMVTVHDCPMVSGFRATSPSHPLSKRAASFNLSRL
jgi:hypothetical protein